MRQRLRVDQPLNRFVERDAGRDEDGEHDGQPRKLLTSEAPQKEGDAERQRGQRVAEVVDQVGEQRDRVREHEDDHLGERSGPEQPEAERHRLHALARADDRAIEETV